MKILNTLGRKFQGRDRIGRRSCRALGDFAMSEPQTAV